jgi:predicted RNA-binding protein with PIN domain
MTLRDAIAKLEQLSEKATLFVERLSGEFKPNSRTVLVELSDADLQRPVVDIAAERAQGTEYFLEIDEAQHVVAGFVESYANGEPSLDEIVERVIYYAENDA